MTDAAARSRSEEEVNGLGLLTFFSLALAALSISHDEKGSVDLDPNTEGERSSWTSILPLPAVQLPLSNMTTDVAVVDVFAAAAVVVPVGSLPADHVEDQVVLSGFFSAFISRS